jgi:hypothetical protein
MALRSRPDADRRDASDSESAMYARALDEAAASLRELRHDEVCRLGAAAVAMALAVAATNVQPDFARPLFLGGLVVGGLGLRALWRRWDLVDRLADEPDAYVIAEVLAYASREATMKRRRSFAALTRAWLDAAGPSLDALTANEIGLLVGQLEDDRLALDPACAVACWRLLSDLGSSPLPNPTLPQADVRSKVRRIRSGFHPPNEDSGTQRYQLRGV